MYACILFFHRLSEEFAGLDFRQRLFCSVINDEINLTP